MRLPNFLIIGAPRCGTTTLYEALKAHPDVYMSPEKEPWYFAAVGQPVWAGPGDAQGIRSWDTYCRLFDGARDQIGIVPFFVEIQESRVT